MSDQEVIAALEAMERMLLRTDPVAPQVLADWRKDFDTAVATAERGPAWAEIVARAHRLAGQVDSATETLSVRRDELRKQLSLQNQGARALQAYKPS